jgi:hypothetical protein
MSRQRLFDYIGSKLPFCLSVTALQCFVFLGLFYFNVHMREVPFVPVWLTMVAITWTSVAIGLFVSSLDPTHGQFSVVLAIIAVLPQLILSGGLGPGYFHDMSLLTQFVANLFPARWGLEMLLTSVYSGVSFQSIAWIPDFVTQTIGFDYGSGVYLKNGFILIMQSCTWLLLCAMSLARHDFK